MEFGTIAESQFGRITCTSSMAVEGTFVVVVVLAVVLVVKAEVVD